MKKLVVVDMQNDFIDGSLGTDEAVSIVDNVRDLIDKYDTDDIYVTLDTHQENYMDTQEGKNLPVEHCIDGSEGWELSPVLKDALKDARKFKKPTFGSVELAEALKSEAEDPSGKGSEITLCGLCTDICVVSNALLIKAFLPEAEIKVAASCCAGVTPEAHEAALSTMRSCQVEVI